MPSSRGDLRTKSRQTLIFDRWISRRARAFALPLASLAESSSRLVSPMTNACSHPRASKLLLGGVSVPAVWKWGLNSSPRPSTPLRVPSSSLVHVHLGLLCTLCPPQPRQHVRPRPRSPPAPPITSHIVNGRRGSLGGNGHCAWEAFPAVPVYRLRPGRPATTCDALRSPDPRGSSLPRVPPRPGRPRLDLS